MRFLARWLANGLAVYLGLYLLDSVLAERFHLRMAYPALLAAVFLGLGNSFIKPLYRAKSRPLQAGVISGLTVLVNLLFLHLFVWAGDGITTTHFGWVLAAAAFLTVITGLLNWLIGFRKKERPRTPLRPRPEQETSSLREKPGLAATERRPEPRSDYYPRK